MKIKILYGINGTREYSDIYEAYVRYMNLLRDNIPVKALVTGTQLERNAWKEMFIDEPDETN